MSTTPFGEQVYVLHPIGEHENRHATKQERNKILAADVARLLEFSTAKTLEYIDLITAIGQSEGDAGVRGQLRADFLAAGIPVNNARLRLCMDALMVEAWQTLQKDNTAPSHARPIAQQWAEHRGCAAPSLVFSLSIGELRPATAPRGSGCLN